MLISSTSNPRFKHLLSLQKKKNRDLEKLFIIEGEREIKRALLCGLKPHSLFESNSNSRSISSAFSKNHQCHQLTSTLFMKISYRHNPVGHIAIFYQPKTDISALKTDQNSIILVLESPEKPGNVGAILRTADATNIDGIIITNPNLDLFNPNVVRSAAGTLFSRPIYQTDNQTAITILKKHRLQIIATTPDTTFNYHQFTYVFPLALVMGPEDTGLSKIWLKQADYKIKIPMLGIADSLNLSVSTGIILYEITKNSPHPL